MHTAQRLWAAAAAVALLISGSDVAEATMRYGDLQLSGNIQTQLLIRTPSPGEFHFIQQRNTVRLQYEHKLVKRGKVLGAKEKMGFIKNIDFFLYWRGVYDGIYDLQPGGILENQDGSRAGLFKDIPGRDRREVAWENVIREIFFDIELADAPISFRIGRQQIVWGEALNFRALDSVNALDLSWHLFFEAGLFGKVGFDELRIPAWTIKMLWDIGSIGPLANAFLEVWDIPFDFQPAEVRFSDHPWGLPFRNAVRPGTTIDVGQSVGLPVPLLVEPCFDLTGNPQNNPDSGADFSEASETGHCDSPGLRKTTLRVGNYDRRDPRDVNQFGVRFSATTPQGITFTLNYMHRRHLGTDIPGAGIAKFQSGSVLSDAANFVHIEPHTAKDPVLQTETDVEGYIRIPVEYYYPYVNVFGASMNFFDEWVTGGVIGIEGTFTHALPLFNANALGSGIKRKDVILAAIGMDKPVKVDWINRRSAFQTFTQINFNYILGGEKIRFGEDPNAASPTAPEIPIQGDVGIPNSALIPFAFIDPHDTSDPTNTTDVDRLKELEVFALTGFVGFFKGGSVVPNFFFLADAVNWPAIGIFAFVDYYPTNNIILTPRFNFFTTFGRNNVSDPWAIARSGSGGNRSEIQLKAVYQF